MVLSIGQTCIWFIIGAIIILLVLKKFESLTNISELKTQFFPSQDDGKTVKLVENNIKIKRAEKLNIAGLICLVVLVIGLFLFFTYTILIDAYVIEDHIFMDQFRFRMKIYALFGYFVASLCFFIYLYNAYKGHQLDSLNAKKNIDS